MNTVIIDYGMGNLLSVKRAFEKQCCKTEIITDPNELLEADRIVLPGVGAFPDAMKNLKMGGWVPFIREAAIDRKIPILGICLGMQLFADKSFENGECAGLGLIHGEVVKLKEIVKDERIPHVGWNDVEIKKDHPIFENIQNNTNYYFVHSYHFVPQCDADILSITPFCGCFVSAVAKDNIIGVQFHPEKSQKAGFKLIRNFIEMR